MRTQQKMIHTPVPSNNRRNNRGLFVLRILTVTFSGFITFLFLYKIPSYYFYLKDTCHITACEYSYLTPIPLETLESAGLTYADLAAIYTTVALMNFAVYVAGALLIWIKRPNEPISYMASAAFITFPASSYIPLLWWNLGNFATMIESASILLFLLFLLVFPTGKMVRGWMFATVVVLSIVRMIWSLEQWPIGLNLIWMVLLYGTLIYTQYIRYRYTASAVERQQTKWFVYGLVLSLTAILVVSILPLLYRADFYSQPNPIGLFVLDLSVVLLLLPIPITLVISILRRRLWDIDPLMNRSIVYGGVSILIIATYSLTVWYLSFLFKTGHNMFFSLIATGITAFIFAPLKEKLQKLINRFMYGEQHDPYTVLLKLGNQLNEPLEPQAVFETVMKTVKEALRLPYVGIELIWNDQSQRVSSVGEEPTEITSIPLMTGGQEIGTLLVSVRSPGESFNEADQRMLTILAKQASTVLQSVIQKINIQQLIEELQQSREQIIMAREEERRTMRNNLHDDIAPRLAAMKLTASLVEGWIRDNPVKALEFIERFKNDISQTVEDIRGIVYDLRPHALDDLGLIGAIRQRAEQLLSVHVVQTTEALGHPLRIDIVDSEELPGLPAAIEVVAFRIVTESLVNVVRHSKADYCQVVIIYDADQSELNITIKDNGIGLENRNTDWSRKGGLGLNSIRERAVELGGQCQFETLPDGGTLISAKLPIKSS